MSYSFYAVFIFPNAGPDVILLEGTSLDRTCVNINPPIYDVVRRWLGPDGGVATFSQLLRFPQLMITDSGIYTCRFVTEDRVETDSFNLTVLRKFTCCPEYTIRFCTVPLLQLFQDPF